MKIRLAVAAAAALAAPILLPASHALASTTHAASPVAVSHVSGCGGCGCGCGGGGGAFFGGGAFYGGGGGCGGCGCGGCGCDHGCGFAHVEHFNIDVIAVPCFTPCFNPCLGF